MRVYSGNRSTWAVDGADIGTKPVWRQGLQPVAMAKITTTTTTTTTNNNNNNNNSSSNSSTNNNSKYYNK